MEGNILDRGVAEFKKLLDAEACNFYMGFFGVPIGAAMALVMTPVIIEALFSFRFADPSSPGYVGMAIMFVIGWGTVIGEGKRIGKEKKQQIEMLDEQIPNWLQILAQKARTDHDRGLVDWIRDCKDGLTDDAL